MTDAQLPVTGTPMAGNLFLIEGVHPDDDHDGLGLAVTKAEVGRVTPEAVGLVVALEKGGYAAFTVPRADWEQIVSDVQAHS